MRFRLLGRLVPLITVITLATASLTGAQTYTASQDRHPVRQQSEVLPAVVECLSRSKEAILFADHVQCEDYRAGRAYLKKEAPSVPLDIDLNLECGPNPAAPSDNKSAHQNRFNGRRLPSDAIYRLATEFKSKIGPHGIRILGAIFCEKVNLVGHDLAFSLVLDSSVFRDGVEIRNAQVKGDLSFDKSFVFRQLLFYRTRVEGSIFADESFIQDLTVVDTTVNGSMLLQESVLFHVARFDGVAIARELSLRASAISYVMIQFSKVEGLLDLSHSEARCAYHINKSEIGFLVAKKAGFGTIASQLGREKDHTMWRAWRRTLGDTVENILVNSDVNKVVSDREGCFIATKQHISQFFLFDSRIRSSLCISEFQWLAPNGQAADNNIFFQPRNGDTDPVTVIAINGNTVGNNLILDLWSNKPDVHDTVPKSLHKLELIGVKTEGLIIDFSDSDRHYFTAVDGLQFARVYHAYAVCEYGPTEKLPMGDRKFSINSDFTDQLQFPKLKEVRAWLDLNEIASTQPFTAFADAFEKAGADSTSIKVDRANTEVCDRAADWALLPIIKHWCASTAKRAENAKVRLASANQSLAASGGSPHLTSAASAAPQQESNTSGSTTQETGWNEINNTVLAFFALLSDFALFLFRAALWLLADHGYRPGKVLLWVSVTLFVYWVVFLVGLKIVGFSPMRKTAARAAPAGEGKPSQEVSSGAANPTGANATPTATQPAPATGTEPSQEASTVAPSTTLVNATSTAKPLGLLFFIDRLLPAYQIVEAHYKIDKYYKWTRGASNPSAEVRRLWFFKLPVEEVKGERELVRIESWLTVLRVVGLIYAIFLAAAVSALVVH